MGINQIPNVSSDIIGKPATVKDEVKKSTDRAGKNDTGLDKSGQKKAEDAAAVYEKSDITEGNKKVYKTDTATIDRLIGEAEKRSQSLRNLVEKMLLKQGETLDDSTDIYALLREGKLQVDPETRAQAQKDIADDGYWGVAQTSERIVSFAKALTGGDPSKADEMIDAVKKGFKEATKTWGGDLPEISKNTIDAAIKGLEDWRDTI
ncbi:MAG TPA: hypothetical protein VJZ06_10200 [Mobilitalea sp.]|nr:hypothetical protein [Mobilitalea sp.]